MPSQLSLVQEYLRDPPFIYTPSVPFLISNDQSLLGLLGIPGNSFAWRLAFYTLTTPVRTALVRLQLTKIALPFRLHQSSENVDDFSFGSKSTETFSLFLTASGSQSSTALPETTLNRHLSLFSILLDGLAQKDGMKWLWKGTWLSVLQNTLLNWSVSKMTLGIMQNCSAQLSQLQVPFESEYLAFALSDFVMRSLMIPFEVLYVRAVNAAPQQGGASELMREAVEQEGLEGLYAHFSYSILTNVITTSCKVLPFVLFDVYFDGKIPIKSAFLHNLASVALKQSLLLGSLLVRIPFMVVQRRLYSRNIYYSKETTNPRGFVACLKGMLVEEGIGAFFRGFWYCWFNENVHYLVRSYLTYEQDN